MTETELQASVIAAAERLGWLVFHAEKSARKVGTGAKSRWIRNQPATGKGFPDLVLLSPAKRMLVFAELKGDRGPRGGERGTALSEEQSRWITGLGNVFGWITERTTDDANPARVHATVWRPANLERIYRLLATGSYD